jgi:hypothetical protein
MEAYRVGQFNLAPPAADEPVIMAVSIHRMI